MNEKICTACRKPLPPTREHFYADPRTSDGLNCYCIPCARTYYREYRLRQKKNRTEKARCLQGQEMLMYVDRELHSLDTLALILKKEVRRYG